jgi:hypothetical protein
MNPKNKPATVSGIGIDQYVAFNNPDQARKLVAKYGVKYGFEPAKNMKDLMRKMNFIIKKEGANALHDIAMIHPDRDLILATVVGGENITPTVKSEASTAEKKSGACGCGMSSCNGEKEQSKCGCSNKTSSAEGTTQTDPVAGRPITNTDATKDSGKPPVPSNHGNTALIVISVISVVAIASFAYMHTHKG